MICYSTRSGSQDQNSWSELGCYISHPIEKISLIWKHQWSLYMYMYCHIIRGLQNFIYIYVFALGRVLPDRGGGSLCIKILGVWGLFWYPSHIPVHYILYPYWCTHYLILCCRCLNSSDLHLFSLMLVFKIMVIVNQLIFTNYNFTMSLHQYLNYGKIQSH